MRDNVDVPGDGWGTKTTKKQKEPTHTKKKWEGPDREIKIAPPHRPHACPGERQQETSQDFL